VHRWFRLRSDLYELARAERIDAVIASRPEGWVAASPAAKRLGVPLLWRAGGRLTSKAQAFFLRVLVGLWDPDALVCNCEAVRHEFESFVHCPRYLLPNGVDTHRFDPRRVQPRFRTGPEGLGTAVIGMAARPAPGKGLDVLVEAMHRISSRIPEVRLLIAGDYGWRQHFEALFESQGLGERVKFLGHVEDVESFYRSCDVMVLPSRDRSIEGSPNAVLEAMSMERPIVATRVGGIPEVMEHGRHGYLVEDGDADALASRVVELLLHAKLRQRMGAAGRARILERHDDLEVARQLSRILHEVTGRPFVETREAEIERAPIRRVSAHSRSA
jgi:glycosyltransferase involved in cell wall biosynthesis